MMSLHPPFLSKNKLWSWRFLLCQPIFSVGLSLFVGVPLSCFCFTPTSFQNQPLTVAILLCQPVFVPPAMLAGWLQRMNLPHFTAVSVPDGTSSHCERKKTIDPPPPTASPPPIEEPSQLDELLEEDELLVLEEEEEERLRRWSCGHRKPTRTKNQKVCQIIAKQRKPN